MISKTTENRRLMGLGVVLWVMVTSVWMFLLPVLTPVQKWGFRIVTMLIGAWVGWCFSEWLRARRKV